MHIKARSLLQAAALIRVGFAWDFHHPQCEGLLQSILNALEVCNGIPLAGQADLGITNHCDEGLEANMLENGNQFCQHCADLTVYPNPEKFGWEFGKIVFNDPPYPGATDSIWNLGVALDSLCKTTKETNCYLCGYTPGTGKDVPKAA